MNETIVQLIDVRKTFGSFVALDNLNLTINQGEFLTLLGPSGCGKTTTLRLIGGFEHPTQGRILLEAQDVANVPPNKRDVNTVFQSYALFPHLTVWENIAFGLKMRGISKGDQVRRITEVLDLVQLSELADRKPNALSGGQQQRVALARALVCHPKVLLLDEPLASLDLQLRRRMQVELKQLQQRVGITFVFVTHDQEEALSVSDRIGVMRDGRLEQLSSPQDIYDNPSSLFVAQFIGETNAVRCQVVHEYSNGSAQILTPLGSLDMPSNRIRRGDKTITSLSATLSVRPERIRIMGKQAISNNSSDNASIHTFTSNCVEVIFMGSAVKASFRSGLSDKDKTSLIHILVPVGELTELPQVGVSYTLGFTPSDCTCFIGG